jgi:hypothetical protein
LKTKIFPSTLKNALVFNNAGVVVKKPEAVRLALGKVRVEKLVTPLYFDASIFVERSSTMER